MLIDQLYEKLEKRREEMVKNRRWFHSHPELSFQEKNTAAFIEDFYREKDVDLTTGLGGYGIKVVIDSGKPGKTIALRGDMDALPIQEETNLPYASSTEGVMHACGHDAHTAYLLSLADCLIEMKADLVGRVVIIHQTGEEAPPGGALPHDCRRSAGGCR